MREMPFFLAVLLCYTFAPNIAYATPGQEECKLPADLNREVVQKYPGSKVVEITDLTNDDRKFFTKDHGTQCPGLVKIDFYGDGKPTWVLVLLDPQIKRFALIVAHKLSAWEFRMLEPWGGGGIPVVWREHSGKYNDIYGTKTVQATHPVIVFCGYESWAIIYAWTGKKVEKLWVSD